MIDPNPYLRMALACHDAGLSVLPPEEDGSKRPMAGGWRRYQQVRASEAEIRAWYANGRTGVGAVMGRVSGAELFEFEHRETCRAFIKAARAAGLGDLIDRIHQGWSERTPGGGVHWYYRCTETGPNTRLARRADGKVLIETRGNGGYAITAPSDGSVHPTGQPYTIINGGPETMATITPEEREELFRLARTFDELPEPVREVRAPTVGGEAGTRPGDLLNARTSWADILTPHGWRLLFERNGEGYWCRPGKTAGISATTNYRGSDLLYVFTTSSVLEAGRAYDRFAAYAYLNHGGDFSAAARELRRQYGPADAPLLIDLFDGTGTVDTSTGEVQEKPPFEFVDARDYLLRPPPAWDIEGLLSVRTFSELVGQPGSGKSFVGLEIACCKATGTPFFSRRVRRGRVLYVCSEGQGGFGKRIAAWEKARGVHIPRGWLTILPGIVQLANLAHVSSLLAYAAAIGQQFDLVIFDTFSRQIPGVNENVSEQMSVALQAIALIQATFGCSVLILHHGRRSDGETRGWGGLIGALDTIIEVTKDDAKVVMLAAKKQKDADEFAPLRLRMVPVDVSDVIPPPPAEDDDIEVNVDLTSVVLEPLTAEEQQAAAEARARERVRMTRQQRAVARALFERWGVQGVTNDEWKEAVQEAGVRVSRQAYIRIRDTLVERKLVRAGQREGVERFYVSTLLAAALRTAPAEPGQEEGHE